MRLGISFAALQNMSFLLWVVKWLIWARLVKCQKSRHIFQDEKRKFSQPICDDDLINKTNISRLVWKVFIQNFQAFSIHFSLFKVGMIFRIFINFHFSNRSNKTFKPKKNIPEGTHQYDLMKHAAATLGSGNLRNAVQLPEGEDPNEWIAVNSEFPPDP